MVGVWLHLQPTVLALAVVSHLGAAAPRSSIATAQQPSGPKPTNTPTALGTATATAMPGETAGDVLTARPVPATTPPPMAAVATLVPANPELPDMSTPTPPAPAASTRAQNGVPILMYHYIRINPVASDRAGFILSVTPSDFALQMRFLVEHGYHTVTMSQVREYVRHGTPLPPKPIAITFDDGYDDAYTAARPVLEQYHLTATFFIITGFLDHPHYMTWAQVEALDRDGMEIGSHTVHHPSLPRLNPLALRFELESSRSDLERHLGHPVLDFGYPGGEFNPTVVRAVAAAGYLSATTTRSGIARRGDDPLELPRLRVWGGMTLRQFADVVGQPRPATRPG